MMRRSIPILAAPLIGSVALASVGCVSVINDYPAARGQVVDGRTGLPIGHAEIITGDSRVAYSKPDGSFTVPLKRSLGVSVMALAPAKGNLFVAAPGYVTVHRKLRPIPSTGSAPSEDLGVIRLMPKTPNHLTGRSS